MSPNLINLSFLKHKIDWENYAENILRFWGYFISETKVSDNACKANNIWSKNIPNTIAYYFLKHFGMDIWLILSDFVNVFFWRFYAKTKNGFHLKLYIWLKLDRSGKKSRFASLFAHTGLRTILVIGIGWEEKIVLIKLLLLKVIFYKSTFTRFSIFFKCFKGLKKSSFDL